MAGAFTVGRHAADDAAGVHPLVAAALDARVTPEPGTHRWDRPVAADPTPDRDGGLGWPGSPGDGSGGLGWPGDVDVRGTPAAAPAPRTSVWRRLFGGAGRNRPVAERTGRHSSAA